MLFELMAVAYEADLTRVFTFMMNREASQVVFPNLGINEPWHHISHHGNDPEKLASLVKINTWQISLFGKFLERLEDHAGRRRLAAGSFGDPVGQRYERQQLPLRARRPAADGGQRRRAGEGRSSHRGAEGDAAGQRDARRRAEVRGRSGSRRCQHRAARDLIGRKDSGIGNQGCLRTQGVGFRM